MGGLEGAGVVPRAPHGPRYLFQSMSVFCTMSSAHPMRALSCATLCPSPGGNTHEPGFFSPPPERKICDGRIVSSLCFQGVSAVCRGSIQSSMARWCESRVKDNTFLLER